MIWIVLHYRETGPLAASPVCEAHHAPSQAWIAAGKLKQRHPRDQVTVGVISSQTDVENIPTHSPAPVIASIGG